MLVSDLMGYNFEILSEEDEEIDIYSIETLDKNNTFMFGKVNDQKIIDMQNKINELIKAVKKLDKNIKEKE